MQPSTEAAAPKPFATFRAIPGRVGRAILRGWKRSRRTLLTLLLLAAIFQTGLNIYASVLLNRELAEIRAKGEPLTFAALAPPAVPAGRNAALVYARAIKALRLTRAEESKLAGAVRRHPTPPAKSRAAIVAKNRAALALIRQAALMPECRFPEDWSGSPEKLRFKHFEPLRQLARMLAADAISRAQSGDSAGALHDVDALFRMSHHMHGEATYIGFLMARSLNSIATQTLATVLELKPVPLHQAIAFQAAVPPGNWSGVYRRALLGERAFMVGMFESMCSSDLWYRDYSFRPTDAESPLPPPWLFGPLRIMRVPWLKLDEVYYLRKWKARLASLNAPPLVPAPPVRYTPAPDDFADAPWYATYSKLMLPTFPASHTDRHYIETVTRAREIALALSAYRAVHGRYPASLAPAQSLWAKPLPLDPYTAKPFLYRPQAQSFQLYSLGPNRRDDKAAGRQHKSTSSRAPGDDIAWNIAATLAPQRRARSAWQ